jgi:hypothetical protein
LCLLASQEELDMKTEISYDELIGAWAPLADVSKALDRTREKAGSGTAGEIIGFMDDKVKWALRPLEACIRKIERENPDQFG